MSISLATESQYECTACGHTGVADLWLLIDVSERPDLVKRTREKRLRVVQCEKCGADAVLATGVLLVYRPGDSKLLFMAENAPAVHQTWTGLDQARLEFLFDHLTARLGSDWDAGIAEIQAATPSLIHLLIDFPRVESLDAVIYRLLAADWWEQRQLIVEHPELTTDDGLAYVELHVLGLRSRLHQGFEEKARDLRRLLGRVREVGTDAALAEVSPTMQMINGLTSIRPSFGAVLLDLFNAGVDVGDRDALRGALDHDESRRTAFAAQVAATRDAMEKEAAKIELDPEQRMNACMVLATLACLDPYADPVSALFHTYAAATVLLGPGPELVARAARAIGCLRGILPSVRADPRWHAQVLVTLADAHVQHGLPSDLERADDCLRRAIGVAPVDAQGAVHILKARGRLLKARVDTWGDDARHAAILVYQDVLDSGETDADTIVEAHQSISVCYADLTTGDRRRNAQRGMHHARLAFDGCTDPARANSALMLLVCFELSVAAEDPNASTDAVTEHLRTGIHQAKTLGFSDSIVFFAERLGALEADKGKWDDAAAAYTEAILAVNRLYADFDLEGDRHQLLSEVRTLNADAAYALAKAGRPREAAEALEQGRARALATSMRRDRVDLAKLDNQRRDLADRFRDAVSRLRVLERHGRGAGPRIAGRPAVALSEIANYAGQAAYEYDAVIREIRALHGFEHFLQPAAFATQVSRLSPGDVMVYLCTADNGSLAVIVDDGGTVGVEFGTLTSEGLTQLLGGDGYAMGQVDDPIRLSTNLSGVLSAVGDGLLAPLAARLIAMQVHRVVLIPCGHLGVLPLHAAMVSPAEAASIPVGRLLDHVEVSYAPSLETYLVARERLEQLAARRLTLVGVGDPEPNPRPLPFARIEMAQVADLFDRLPQATSTVLVGVQASTLALLANVGAATHVHLACHGYFSPETPLDSGLVMAGEERLTLRDVMESRDFDGVRMVVMSACQTGMTAVDDLPEEVIGLPSGFMHAGVPAVVGALWSVDDVSTAVLMRAFYEYLQADASHTPAAAMRAAQRRIATMTYAEAQDFIDSDLTRGSDSRNVRGMSRALGPAPDAERAPARDCPFADPYYWAAFTVNGC
jgi:CHAT domain-containing protein